MINRCLPFLAVLLAAPAFAQPDRPVPDTTVTVPHWPEQFGADSFLHGSRVQPFASLAPFSADSALATPTSPEARAEAAIVDPDIVMAPDSGVDARMRLFVPPAHADEEMMQDPGPARSQAADERPAGQR